MTYMMITLGDRVSGFTLDNTLGALGVLFLGGGGCAGVGGAAPGVCRGVPLLVVLG